MQKGFRASQSVLVSGVFIRGLARVLLLVGVQGAICCFGLGVGCYRLEVPLSVAIRSLRVLPSTSSQQPKPLNEP